MELEKVFSENLKKIRKTLGVSQDTLALKSGIKKSHISKIENNPQNVKLETLENLARGLGIEAKDLIDAGLKIKECPKCLERDASINLCLKNLQEASSELRDMKSGKSTNLKI